MDQALRENILSILSNAKDLTIATLRDDGYPQATTVSFAHEGLFIYFGCSSVSQKARNIARDNRVSLAVNLPYDKWSSIRGLSLAGRAIQIVGQEQFEQAGRILLQRFPEAIAEYASDEPEGVTIFRIKPEIISVLDYRKGFGHSDIVICDGLDETTDIVEEADLESFPVSDQPAWTRTTSR